MPAPEKGRIAGIDYGTVRIGVALCDPDHTIAFPYEIYIRKNEKKDAEYFRQLVTNERVVHFVVGLPLHLNGQLSEKAIESLNFGRWLTEITCLQVDYMDERFTSSEAEGYLLEIKMTRKKRKARIDKIAAQILLTNYLERGCQGTTEYRSLDDK